MAQEVCKYCRVAGSTWSFPLCSHRIGRASPVPCQPLPPSVPSPPASWRAQPACRSAFPKRPHSPGCQTPLQTPSKSLSWVPSHPSLCELKVARSSLQSGRQWGLGYPSLSAASRETRDLLAGHRRAGAPQEFSTCANFYQDFCP